MTSRYTRPSDPLTDDIAAETKRYEKFLLSKFVKSFIRDDYAFTHSEPGERVSYVWIDVSSGRSLSLTL